MTNEDEIWKVYPDYPFIEVSSLGRIRTKDRVVTYKNGRKHFYKGRALKQHLDRYGYLYVSFHVNGKTVNLKVHRIVAIMFIPNPNNYPQVNHIDNDRTNNVISNLEWCTNQYNQDYRKNFGTSPAQLFGKPVIAINQETSEVFWFESQYEAGRKLSISNEAINNVVRGRRDATCGCWFCKVDEIAVEKVRAKFGDIIAEQVEKLIREHL